LFITLFPEERGVFFPFWVLNLSLSVDLKKESVSDKKLWEDFKRGRKYALSLIYEKYVRLLYQYGWKFVREPELIKDTIQDLFYDLIRTRENLGEVDNIKFYLIVSFRRKLLQSVRKKPFSTELPADNMPGTVFMGSYEEEWIEAEGVSEQKIMLNEGLMKLSPNQREILFYRFTCDFTYEEICEIMSLKYDSARKLSFRAVKTLKKHLTGPKEKEK